MNRRARKLVAQDGLKVLEGRIVATACMVDAALQRAMANVLEVHDATGPHELRVTVPISHAHRAIQVVVTASSRRPQQAETSKM